MSPRKSRLNAVAAAPAYSDIAAAVVRQDFDTVIVGVREAIAADGTVALSDPVIKEWLGRRYRNIFLTECAADGSALRAAKVPMPIQLIDRRSSRELLAARFLKGVNREEFLTPLPPAKEPKLKGTTLLFVPGLMTGLLPVMAFQSVWGRIEDRFGVRILGADVHPVRSCEANTADIRRALDKGRGFDADSQHIPAKEAKKPKDVVMLGYDKGAADALTFLVDNPQLRDRVKAFVGWAGIFGGSYIADDISARLGTVASSASPLSGQIGKMLRQIVPVVQADRITSRLEQYDVQEGIGDITTFTRAQYLAEHVEQINELGVPTFSVEGVTSLREVPYYQAMGVLQLNSYDKNNDMLITSPQARLPVAHATTLASFRAHHWDLAYDPFPWFTRMGSQNVDHKFARYPAMAALLILLTEVGLMN